MWLLCFVSLTKIARMVRKRRNKEIIKSASERSAFNYSSVSTSLRVKLLSIIFHFVQILLSTSSPASLVRSPGKELLTSLRLVKDYEEAYASSSISFTPLVFLISFATFGGTTS